MAKSTCGYCGAKKRWWNKDWYFGIPGFCNPTHRRYYLQDQLESRLKARAKRTPSADI